MEAYELTNPSRTHAGATYVQPPTSVQAPFFVEVRERIGAIHGELGNSAEALGTLRQRMFGSWPQSGSLGNANPAKADCQVNDLLDYLDAVLRSAREVREHAEALNGSI